MGNDTQTEALQPSALPATSRLDRYIAAVFPGWASRRVAARLQIEAINFKRTLAASYAAAEKNRLSYDWTDQQTSADSALLGDQATLVARARSAARDDWAAAAILSGFRRHVVGTGITAKAAARDPWSGKAFKEFNRAADRLWKRWIRARHCDLERKKNFRAFQALMQTEKVTAGEGFIAIRVGPDRTDRRLPRIILQAFEVEQLDTTRYENPETGLEIRNGIEIDRYGAAVAYWVFTDRHPQDTSFSAFGLAGPRDAAYESERIPAEDICHLARWERPRQTHGVTRLAPVLRKMRHLGMYDEYQMVAARMEACYGAFIQAPQASQMWGPAPGAGASTSDAKGNRQMDFEPGMVIQGLPGESITFHDPKRPGELYDPFVKAQVNHISTGAGLDYVTVVRDFTGGTYSGQRQGMIERDYEIEPEQEDLIDIACMEIRDAVISMAILEGLLEAPGFGRDVELSEAYLEADWRPQAKPWIDPANQASAAETALRNRLTTRRTILNELGEDCWEVFDQLADEEAYLQQRGLSGGEGSQQQSTASGQQAGEKPAATQPDTQCASPPPQAPEAKPSMVRRMFNRLFGRGRTARS